MAPLQLKSQKIATQDKKVVESTPTSVACSGLLNKKPAVWATMSPAGPPFMSKLQSSRFVIFAMGFVCKQYSPSASEYRWIFSKCHMARGVHGWLSLHICRAALGEANIGEVNHAHRGPYHELNISRYSRTRGEYCTYTWKVRTKASCRRPCFASACNCSACTCSGPLRPNWFDRSFSTCIRQLADSSDG